MNLTEMAQAEGGYQDIEVNGQKVFNGWRSCNERWDLIKPHIKPHQVVVDIGSHYGYFAAKIAQDKTNLVWSIEPHKQRAAIQKEMLKANNLSNVILSRTEIDLVKLLHLQRTCEHFDTILCLSTIHYFPPEQIPEILWAFSQLAPNLIIEFPNAAEDDVAEKDVVDGLDAKYLLEQIYDNVQAIGTTPSPKHKDIQRTMYRATNFNITRRNCSSYWNSYTGGNHVLEYEAGQWLINGRQMSYNGLNLANLSEFKVIYPNPKTWIADGAQRYYDLIRELKGQVTDIHPRNLIVAHNGTFPIDYSESTRRSIYGLPWSQYRLLIETDSAEDLTDWLYQTYKSKHRNARFNNESP